MTVVVQLSDTHLRRERGPQDEALERAVAAVRRSLGAPPDLVVLSGDVADDGSEEALARVAELVAPLSAPVLALGGNHDLPGSIDAVFGPPEPRLVGGWRVVALDTFVAGEIHGSADPEAARAVLDADRTSPTVVFQHHPPVGPSSHPWFTLRRRAELLEVLAAQPQVRGLGAGHLHQAFHAAIGAVHVVGAPSTWYAIRHEGHRWAKAPSAVIGGVVWQLGDDGRVATSLVAA